MSKNINIVMSHPLKWAHIVSIYYTLIGFYDKQHKRNNYKIIENMALCVLLTIIINTSLHLILKLFTCHAPINI